MRRKKHPDLHGEGPFILSRLTATSARLAREMVFNASFIRGLDEEGKRVVRRAPSAPENVSASSCLMMMEVINFESQNDVMGICPALL